MCIDTETQTHRHIQRLTHRDRDTDMQEHTQAHTHTWMHRHAPRHKYTDTQRYQTFLLTLHLINHSGKFFRGFGRPGL